MASPLSSSLGRSARSLFVSHLSVQPGDRSVLLVRERPVESAVCEHFTLHGAFDSAATERLSCSLRGQSSALPLVLDLRGIIALDEASVTRLLKLKRELSAYRPVSFQIADGSPAAIILCRLGLEESFGLAPARLPLRRTAVPGFASAEKSLPREFAVS